MNLRSLGIFFKSQSTSFLTAEEQQIQHIDNSISQTQDEINTLTSQITLSDIQFGSAVDRSTAVRNQLVKEPFLINDIVNIILEYTPNDTSEKTQELSTQLKSAAEQLTSLQNQKAAILNKNQAKLRLHV